LTYKLSGIWASILETSSLFGGTTTASHRHCCVKSRAAQVP